MNNKLCTPEEVAILINQNKVLALAADENILKSLPKGNWIGGSIPYFMDTNGGCLNENKVFVTDYTNHIVNFKIKAYSNNQLNEITKDAYSNGFINLLLPCMSEIHQKYALQANTLNGLYNIPIFGWITGVNLDVLGKTTPKTFSGLTGKSFDNSAIALHAEIPNDKVAQLEIINLFKQGNGDIIKFYSDGFNCTDCEINGQKRNLAEYINENNIDIKLPLVANYSGAMVNISFQAVNSEKKTVDFYAPVIKDVEYRIAAPVNNYMKEFKELIPPDNEDVIASCNCILNYLYSELDGEKTANFRGPFTFGEIAYIVVNQTMVYLSII